MNSLVRFEQLRCNPKAVKADILVCTFIVSGSQTPVLYPAGTKNDTKHMFVAPPPWPTTGT